MTTSATFLTEEMRRQAIGRESAGPTLEVEKGAIIKFAQAIGDPNPLWNDEAAARKTRYGGLIAPPTFLRIMGHVRPPLPFDLPFQRLLDGGSEWEHFEPIRPGDRISSTARVESISERPGRLGVMIIVTTRVTYRNQFNEVVATQASTSIRY